MYFAHANLSKFKRDAPVLASVQSARETAAAGAAGGQRSIKIPKMENAEVDLGMRIAFADNATLLSISFGTDTLSSNPSTTIARINQAMLRESTFFNFVPFWVDFVDTRMTPAQLRTNDYETLLRPYLNSTPSGYGVTELQRHEHPKIPPFVNPYHVPTLGGTNPNAANIRIRLWISPALRASFSTKTTLAYFGLVPGVETPQLELKHSTAIWFQNASNSEWASVTGHLAPAATMTTGAAFRLDIEKSSKAGIGDIRASRSFVVSAAAQESDAALASELSQMLALLTAETNIKMGVALDEDGKFKFQFATNGRASMNYTVSSNLADRLRTASTTITSVTPFLSLTAVASPEPAETSDAEQSVAAATTVATEAEELASNILDARENGLIYVCSPHGETENFPSKAIAILSPAQDGSYRMLDAAFLTSPLVCNGAFLRSLPSATLGLHFYTQDTSGKFERFAPAENMRFQGCIVWRTANPSAVQYA